MNNGKSYPNSCFLLDVFTESVTTGKRLREYFIEFELAARGVISLNYFVIGAPYTEKTKFKERKRRYRLVFI